MQCRKTRKNELKERDQEAAVGLLSSDVSVHVRACLVLSMMLLYDGFETIDLCEVSAVLY